MNNSILDCVVFVIAEIFSIYTLFRTTRILLGKKTVYGRKIEIFSYSLWFFVNLLLYFSLRITIVLLITNVIMHFIIAANYCTTLMKKIVTVFFITMLYFCVDMTVSILVSFPFLSPFAVSPYFPLIGTLIIRVLNYLSMLLLERLSRNINKFKTAKKNWVLLILIPVSTIYLFTMASNILIPASQRLLVTLLIFVVNLIMIYLFDILSMQADERARKILMDQELIGFQKQLEVIQFNLNYWHQMQNAFVDKLTLLKEYLGDGTDAQIKDFIGQNFDDFFIKNNVNSGVASIDSILNYHIREAASCQIQMRHSIAIPHELIFDSVEITVILSCLYSYVKEQVLCLDEEMRTIDLEIKFKYSMYRLIFMIVMPLHTSRRNDKFCPPNIFTDIINRYNGTLHVDDKPLDSDVLERGIALTLFLKKENFPTVIDE